MLTGRGSIAGIYFLRRCRRRDRELAGQPFDSEIALGHALAMQVPKNERAAAAALTSNNLNAILWIAL